MLAIIGGTGLANLANLKEASRRVVRTPYGEPSGPLTFGTLGGEPVVFLARHGYGHTIPPHAVNYRANIWALHAQKPARVIAVAAVGGIRANLGPGSLVVPDQILDYTYGRAFTYFDSPELPVTHIDFTRPYCQDTRRLLMAAIADAGEVAADGGVYAATQGPRLETAAEINRLERDGADVVGMTGMPEAALAREQGLNYAALAVVANFAAGRGDSSTAVSMEELVKVLRAAMARVRLILEKAVARHAG
jgi:5'-methylthioadenosine phosphorylase